MTNVTGGECNVMNDCGIWIIFAALIGGIIVWLIKNSESSFFNSRAKFTPRGKAKFDQGQPGWLGATPNKQRLTGPIADNRDQGMLMMNPSQYNNYMNAIYPPKTTVFKPGADGLTQCAVSSVNNCPQDLYHKCNQRAWSKEAIGEALALSSVGSYYLPSGVEEENLHKVVALAHDPTSVACSNAAGLTPYARTNPNLGAATGL